ARAIGAGGASEERIDSGTVTVLTGPTGEAYRSVFSEEVEVRRRHVYASALDRLAVDRRPGLQRSRAIENRGQHAGAGGKDVQHHEDRSGKLGWETLDQLAERLHAT